MIIFNEDVLDDIHELNKDLIKKEKNFSDADKKQNLDVIQKEFEGFVKTISARDNKNELKKPNVIVKLLRWLKSLYQKTLVKAHSQDVLSDGKSKRGFFENLKIRILRFINRLLTRLETLVDRRTFEQISSREKFDLMNNLFISHKHNSSDFRDMVGSTMEPTGKYYPGDDFKPGVTFRNRLYGEQPKFVQFSEE